VDKTLRKDDGDKVKHLVESGVVVKDGKDFQKQLITGDEGLRNFLSRRVQFSQINVLH